MDQLLARFDQALIDLCRRSLVEAGYHPSYFLDMFHRLGGLSTVQRLIRTTPPPKGFTSMWERRRLDLTIEALIQHSEWHELFTDDERELARRRLAEYGYVV